MTMIYVPQGRAREYSPLALNLYIGCSHLCKYCYAPSMLKKEKKNYFKIPEPRQNLLENLEKELKKQAPKEQVLLSFIGDVYCKSTDDNRLTRDVLEILNKYNVPVAILTKGILKSTKDIEIFKKFGEHIQVGTTLTFDNEKDSLEWEPGAEFPDQRIEGLKILHKNGIKTFASFEPVIKPEQSLRLINKTLDIVDLYKIGKINNYKGIDKQIDWTDFLEKAVQMLRSSGKQFYIKKDLRDAAPLVNLRNIEIEQDKNI